MVKTMIITGMGRETIAQASLQGSVVLLPDGQKCKGTGTGM